MNVLAIVFSVLCGLMLAYSVWEELTDINRIVSNIFEERLNQKNWTAHRARVIKVKIGLEYEKYFSFINSEKDLDSPKSKERARELWEQAENNTSEFGDVNITYEYKVDGKVYKSRRISCLPDESKARRYARFISENNKKVIKVLVDPSDPKNSVLYLPKKTDISSVKRKVILSDKSMYAKVLLSILLFSIALLSIKQ